MSKIVLQERRRVERDSGFQAQVRRLGELVRRFEATADTPEKDTAKELLQLLMEVNGSGIERMLELVFESGSNGAALIDRLAHDEMVGGLLLLYSLHPDASDVRIQKAVDEVRPKLRKLGYSIDLLGIENGVTRVSLNASGHSCGSTAREVRSLVENALYEAAPEISSLEIAEVQNPTPAGFVALESLVGDSAPTRSMQPAETQNVTDPTSVHA